MWRSAPPVGTLSDDCSCASDPEKSMTASSPRIFKVRASRTGTGLPLAEVEQVLDALAEHVDAELAHHVVHLALAGVHGRDLRLQVAMVLLGHADVGQHHIEQRLVQRPPFIE